MLFAFVLTAARRGGQSDRARSTCRCSVVGLIVTLVAIIGWLRDAMREWRAADHGGTLRWPWPAGDVAALHGGGDAALSPCSRGAALSPSRSSSRVEPPPGVHMPGPSPWPFFVPIAVTLMLFGLIFSARADRRRPDPCAHRCRRVAAGLRCTSTRRPRSSATPSRRHATHTRRGPSASCRSSPCVIAISLLIALAPVGPELPQRPHAAVGRTNCRGGAGGARDQRQHSHLVRHQHIWSCPPAGRSTSCSTTTRPACRTTSRSRTRPRLATFLFHGERITGVAQITYHVPAIAEGDYYFLCEVHLNMNGTLQSRPEAGGPPGGPAGSGAPSGPPPAP